MLLANLQTFSDGIVILLNILMDLRSVELAKQFDM
jgi:hypothetical protein